MWTNWYMWHLRGKFVVCTYMDVASCRLFFITYIYRFVHFCLHTYIYACTSTHTHTHRHMYILVYVCLHKYVLTFLHIYVNRYKCTYIHIYTHTASMSAYIHTYIQTHGCHLQTVMLVYIQTNKHTNIPVTVRQTLILVCK